MRFKATLTTEQVAIFSNVVKELESIGNKAALYLCGEGVRFAVITESIDAPKCYAELKPSELFHVYRIESTANNQILLEIDLSSLSQALTSAKNSLADSIQIKLTKKDGHSHIAVVGKGQQILSYDILHYISIILLQPTHINQYLPPDVPPPEVALELPSSKCMRTVIDRMGKMAKTLSLSAFQSGRMILSVRQENVNIKTYFGSLTPKWGMLEQARHYNNRAKIQLDIRKFSNVLKVTFAQSFEEASIYVADDSTLVIYLILKPDVGTITIYIPVTARNDDLDQDDED